ncbi:catalase [Brachybacterium huguangmaarense]|uniref:Catalase n=1 Tax=Brachybacterium huguangmaarense TaxID=1652028 RepID=A0ABY6G1L8_9MICO|nr:catalase [Brachybacterium huguangmaarense]UYG17090.1 catalase [Brachybacterium huguangmaarense]
MSSHDESTPPVDAADGSGPTPPSVTPAPGRPGARPPQFDEPTTPTDAPLTSPDQAAAEPRTPTGAVPSADDATTAQQGERLTTSQGARLRDTDHSLRAGARGPVLLQDHHLREKITHFDHERIPERVVHARGAAAHGVFESFGTAASVTCADFLAPGRRTEVFTRFSTVVGSRGSMDTARDTRGFATKFYTDEGTFDLVGNNIPVFFIQDAIKFPDVIHAAKPHPDREIPQAQSAHDTFWDFVSLHTEAQHHTIWFMADRGIPRSFRMMEGFGIHTFRLTNADGETSLVKFHWKPLLGVHSLTWEEAQMIGGTDPDFHRRDLADAIEAGAYPQWELGLQVLPDDPEQMFDGIDLLDPTKIIPEELVPVQRVGRLTLDHNPRNYFAETEQVAFHPGNLVPGIDVTDDPLLQGRLFSYLDTQITRLGGPNFAQLPINRAHAPVNDMLRDGYGQQADHAGVAPYRPNSLDGGCPFTAGADEHAFEDLPVRVAESVRERRNPESFSDHFTQPRMFWASMTDVEKAHIVSAYAFELGRCYETTIRERQLACLAQIDPELCRGVAEALGLPAPKSPDLPDVTPSPALSQVGGTWPVAGRTVGIVVDPEAPDADLAALHEAVVAVSMTPLVIAPVGGTVGGVPVGRTFATGRSVELDAVLLAGAPAPGADAVPALDVKAGAPGAPGTDPRLTLLLEECWRHAKPIGAWGAGRDAATTAGLTEGMPGVHLGEDAFSVLEAVAEQLAQHRVWERFEAPSFSAGGADR